MPQNQTVYFIIPALYPHAGGLTKAMYDKASFLAEHFHVEILTTAYRGNHSQVHREIVKAGKLSDKVIVRNLFTDIARSNKKISAIPRFDFEDLLYNLNNLIVDNLGNRQRIFGSDGIYQNFISYDNDKIHFIDYMDRKNPSILDKRYTFDNGHLFCLDLYESGQKIQQIIFNRNKVPIFNLWHKNNNPSRTFDMRGDKVKDTIVDEITENWISSVITENSVVFVDAFFSTVEKYLRNINCKTVGFIHSHQDHDNDARFSKTYSGFDKYVFLTKVQQQDFKSINPALYAKSTVIPHPVLKTSESPTKENKIVSISRLVPNKPIAPAIQAFAKIADKFPNYIYEIYGNGPERDNIQNLIQNLGMQDRIFLRGYTNSPLREFEKAQLSITLTKFEGYGLSILESLGMSCPVITSDVKYGPVEMIDNGINGFLIKHDDSDALAEAIESILENPFKYQSACLKSIDNNLLELWQQRIIELVQ